MAPPRQYDKRYSLGVPTPTPTIAPQGINHLERRSGLRELPIHVRNL